MATPLLASANDAPQPERLTEVERSFIKLCCLDEGLPYKLIAHRMHIELCTLHTHRRKVFEKLKVPSRTALVLLAMRSGLG